MKRLTAVLLLLLTLDTAQRVRAQGDDPLADGYLRMQQLGCAVTDPVDHPIHHLLCQYELLQGRIAELEGDVAELPTRVDVNGIAWTKANDAIFAKQRAWANPATGDPWLVNFTRQRISRYNCAAGVPSLDRCPAAELVQP